jgi:polyether ionophore transport system permease protein
MIARVASLPARLMPRRLVRQSTPKPQKWPLHGPGSVFRKGMLDSRRAIVFAGVGFGLLILSIGAAAAAAFPTAISRTAFVSALVGMGPAIAGLLGDPINVDRLGGLISWRIGGSMQLLFGLWSFVALSGTLGSEIRNKSLEMLAAAPISRRRLAIEKIGVHLVGLALAVVILSVITTLTGAVYGTVPGDDIPFPNALAQFASTALLGLVGGAVAFALSSFVGRGAAAGLGAVALFAAYLINAYSSVVSALEVLKPLSWISWAAKMRPLAGSWDVVSMIPVIVLLVVLFGLGVLAFERRDLGAAVSLPRVGLPGRRFLMGSPAGQGFLAWRGGAIAWGASIGAYGFLVAISGSGFVKLANDPNIAKLIDALYSGVPWRTPEGFLQLAFFSFGIVIMGLATATYLSGIASDENEKRLDMLLSTPVSRARWLIGTSVGLYAAIALQTLVMGLLAAIGVAGGGGDPVQPFVGVWIAGLYAAALAGIGIAVFGLGFVGLTAATPAILVFAFFLYDLIATTAKFSPEFAGLSLSAHLGQPMIGIFDVPGTLLLLALAVGGVAVGALGMHRRDLST